MPTNQLFLIGAGGHAKVVLDAWQQTESTNIFVWDDDLAREGQLCLGFPIKSPISLDTLPAQGHVAIGANGVRRQLATAVLDSGRTLQTIVHPASSIARHSVVADGAFVAANALVGPDAHVGCGTIINHGAIVDHDCCVGVFSHIAPNATLGGGVIIGDECLIGAGAIILPGLKIADGTIIGAGAVVTNNVVNKGKTLKGVPAR